MQNSKVCPRLKAQLTKFTFELSERLSKPLRRFVGEMLFGIQASQDVELSNIARSLNEEIPLIEKGDRLSRNLQAEELEEHSTDGLVSSFTCLTDDTSSRSVGFNAALSSGWGKAVASEPPVFIPASVWRRVEYFSCTRRIIEFLEKDLSAPAGLERLAELACMERTAFSRSFKRKTGMTPHEFVRAYRISHAAEMLRVSDCSVTEAAFGAGFGSLAAFERAFKRVTGALPSVYRADVLGMDGVLGGQEHHNPADPEKR